MSFSLALIFLGGLSFYLGGREYPRYGKMPTYSLILVGVVGLAVVGAFLGFRLSVSPNLIKFFHADTSRWHQSPRRKFEEKLRLARAINIETGETLPALPRFGSTRLPIFLEIAKEKDAEEIVIRELTLTLKDYQEIKQGDWRLELHEATVSKVVEYEATLDSKNKIVYAENETFTNPQITNNFTNPLLLYVSATKPGIYTFSCKVEVTCHTKKDQRETEIIKVFVGEFFDDAIQKKGMPKGEEVRPPKNEKK